MLLTPYRQISSSFMVGNKDRFGESFLPLKPYGNIPGPGDYSIPSGFDAKNEHFFGYAAYHKKVLSRNLRSQLHRSAMLIQTNNRSF